MVPGIARIEQMIPASHKEEAMELVIVLALIGALVLFDVLALRYGADSRVYDNNRPNW